MDKRRLKPIVEELATQVDEIIALRGGAGSGDWGHQGRPGQVGGSGGGGGHHTLPEGHQYHKPKLKPAEPAKMPDMTPRNAERVQKRKRTIVFGLAEKHGMKKEEYIKEVEKRMTAAMQGVEVFTRVPEEVLGLILKDGRIKSQFETSESRGFYNPEFRSKLEKDVIGVEPDIDPAKRPIYGYLSSDPTAFLTSKKGTQDFNENLEAYGSVAIQLKPDVKSRTTFSLDDTFQADPYPTEFVASPMTKPSYLTLASSDMPDLLKPELKGAKIDDRRIAEGQYPEAQIHGGVSTKDIAKVIFADDEMAFKYHKELDKAGIPWSYASKR